ncbi:hypothetical protein MRX96_054478 [Rhipicephalus microplus]
MIAEEKKALSEAAADMFCSPGERLSITIITTFACAFTNRRGSRKDREGHACGTFKGPASPFLLAADPRCDARSLNLRGTTTRIECVCVCRPRWAGVRGHHSLLSSHHAARECVSDMLRAHGAEKATGAPTTKRERMAVTASKSRDQPIVSHGDDHLLSQDERVECEPVC